MLWIGHQKAHLACETCSTLQLLCQLCFTLLHSCAYCVDCPTCFETWLSDKQGIWPVKKQKQTKAYATYQNSWRKKNDRNPTNHGLPEKRPIQWSSRYLCVMSISLLLLQSVSCIVCCVETPSLPSTPSSRAYGESMKLSLSVVEGYPSGPRNSCKMQGPLLSLRTQCNMTVSMSYHALTAIHRRLVSQPIPYQAF